MGNAESNVTSGIKRQAEASSCELYKLMDLKGTLFIIHKFHNKSFAGVES